jgi:predicted acetyltransferase
MKTRLGHPTFKDLGEVADVEGFSRDGLGRTGGISMAEQLALVRLEIPHQRLLLDFVEDFHSAGESRFPTDILEKLQTDFGTIVQQFKCEEAGNDLPEGKVPQGTLWLIHQGSKLLGRVNLRHRLTPDLEHHGGHIGCFIRPSARGKG